MVALQQWATPADGYGVPGDAVPVAVPPAVTSATEPVRQEPYKAPTAPGPGGAYPQQSVPGGGPSVPGSDGDEPELYSQATDETYANPQFEQGPWPWSDEFGEPLGTVPDDGIDPDSYAIAAKNSRGLIGAWERNQDHEHHNLESQNTDSAGWQVNTPAARTGRRRLTGQSYPGVDNFWPPTGVRPTPQRLAQTAIPLNGNLAEFGGIYNGGGNLAYETPAQPATSTIPPASAAPSGDGLNQFGEF